MNMRHFHESRWTIFGVTSWLLMQARFGLNRGAERDLPYIQSCTAAHYPTGSQVILTRDTGHHTCGWWKNPDYEHCLHLSLCFRDVETGDPAPQNHRLACQWIEAVFGDDKRLIWSEPPFSPEGRKRDVWHYRLFFCDPEFIVPILPRGEVYSKEFTEAGWLSWSDLHAKLAAETSASPPTDDNTFSRPDALAIDKLADGYGDARISRARRQ